MVDQSINNIPKEEKLKLNELLSDICSKNNSKFFLLPPQFGSELEKKNYLAIVKEPMDLQQIKKNLSQGLYQNKEQVLDDIQQIWDNCKCYNSPQGSTIFFQALLLEKFTEKKSKEFFGEVEYGKKSHAFLQIQKIKEGYLEFKKKKRDMRINEDRMYKLLNRVRELCLDEDQMKQFLSNLKKKKKHQKQKCGFFIESKKKSPNQDKFYQLNLSQVTNNDYDMLIQFIDVIQNKKKSKVQQLIIINVRNRK